jgi:hypothetical protein
MAKDTEQLDHRTEALRLMALSDDESDLGRRAAADHHGYKVLVHSNLAIAQGQERVAEELKQVRTAIDGIAYGMGVNSAAAAEGRP